ncbi:hypothetical protein E1A91_D05G294900v1 [Gossypium mustelinum]|uniref:Uncharacterized protein n=1 Tax=Gossypium mustelinum TaxID=34275 RepID=A0A5D2V295_GOSMU|nr:hypothetical protein E1A91_D05G294900v1 [Gossypium mustelinum]
MVKRPTAGLPVGSGVRGRMANDWRTSGGGTEAGRGVRRWRVREP